MILRLKGVIAHDHDTKLLGEDGEGTAIGRGTRPSPKAKPLEEDPRDAPTHGRANRPNPKKDPTPAYGRGEQTKPKRKSHIHRCGRRRGLGKAYTHPTADGG